MKKTENYEKSIKSILVSSMYFEFGNIEMYDENLQVNLDINDENWHYILNVEGNDILGYNLFCSKISFGFDGREANEKDKLNLEKLLYLNEYTANKLKFNHFVVHVNNEFVKNFLGGRDYMFEKPNDYLVAVMKLK